MAVSLAEKACTKCGEIKTVSEFYIRDDRRMAHCKACNTYLQKEWRRKNPEKRNYIFKKFLARKKLKAILRMGGQCQNQECGFKPATILEYGVLEFHHRKGNRGKERLAGVARNILKGQTKDYMVLCANCHVIQNYIDGTQGILLTILSEEEFKKALGSEF